MSNKNFSKFEKEREGGITLTHNRWGSPGYPKTSIMRFPHSTRSLLCHAGVTTQECRQSGTTQECRGSGSSGMSRGCHSLSIVGG